MEHDSLIRNKKKSNNSKTSNVSHRNYQHLKPNFATIITTAETFSIAAG
jgi:hypothetical protein